MRKITLILSLLVAMVTTAMGQINVSTTEGAPEHRYILRNANNKFVTSTTGMTGNMNEAGHFAFYATDKENAYYIYSINDNKWLTYEIAGGYNNQQNFVTLSDSKGEDDKFYFRAYNNGEYYDIAPYNNSGVAAKYLNWYQGKGERLGLWEQGANVDAGSKWFLEEEITSIDKLSNDKVYFLQSSRGHLLYNSGNAGVIASSKAYGGIDLRNDASLWAIYKSPDTGKYYFYNIAADKFIGQNSDEGGRFPFVEKPTNDIQIVKSTKNGYPFVFSTDNYGAINHFNHTAAPGVANWKGNNSEGGLRSLADDGSAHKVYSVKTLSEDEKARIANLVSAFENIEVVYNFTYNGNTIATQTSAAKNGDAEYPDITVTFPFGVSATKPAGSVTASDAENTQTFNIEVELNLPFQISELDGNGKFGSDMHWYKMTLKGKDVRCQDYKSIANATYGDDITPNDLYAFTGNPFDGYKIYNMMAGSSKVLWSSWVNDNGNPIPMTPVDSVTEGTDWLLNANADGYGFKRKGTDNAYVNSRGETFSYWTSASGAGDDGSRITFTEKAAYVNPVANNYKTAVLAALDIWAACFDVATVKESIENTEAEGGTLVEFINDALSSVFADKYFTIRNADQNTGSVRYNTYLSAKSNDKNEAYGEMLKDNDAVWVFKLFGKDFYLYNELNNVYLGTPGSNGDLTANPTYLYYFDNAIAQEGVSVSNALELHCGDETLHMNNHNSEGNHNNRFLSSYDDDYASCWYIELYEEHIAMIEAALEAEKNNHAETPELGQYTTAAYNALYEFNENKPYTIEEAIVALDAFNRAKNRPLYYIEGQISYAKGKAIYEITADELKFKEIDLYDRTMLWAMDQATETVAITDEVVLTNYASANGFWGADYISIIETEPAVENDGIFMFKTNGTGYPVHAQETNSVIVRWSSAEANTVGGGSTWKFVYVGNSYYIDQLTDEKIEALLALKAAHSARKEHYEAAVIGDAIGEYTLTSKEAFDAILAAGEEIYSASLTEQALKSIADINEAKTNINNATMTINQPATNKYYRIKGADETQSLSGYYITGNTNWDGGRIALKAEADASTIYYLTEDKKFVAYQSGLAIALNNNYYTFATIDDNSHPASVITFKESPRTAGAYSIKSADRFLHYKVYEGTVELDRCQNDVHNEHDWYLEEVTTLPVTVTAVGYATFYAPVEVKVPADSNVKAHTVVVDGEKAMLSEEPLETIPANTGVVLMNEGTANLEIVYGGTAEAIEDNNLQGTIAKELKSKENGAYYVLGYLDVTEDEIYNPEVGFYNAAKGEDTTKFYNAGHKAYLFVPGAQASAGLRFDFGGTTAIEEVVVENNENVIYDLQGRRVSEITKAGIYIINGHKVFVK